MTIDSIINGIVLDHITAGKSMEIYEILELSRLDCQVAIIKNAMSKNFFIITTYPFMYSYFLSTSSWITAVTLSSIFSRKNLFGIKKD